MSFPTPSKTGALRVLAAVGLAGSIVAGGTVNAQAATGVQRPDWAAIFVGQINGARAAYHHAALTPTSALTTSAQRWAASMARSNTLAHNPRLATSVTGWRYLGENVGVGYHIGDLKHAFWQSAGHRANMLDSDFTQVGVAVVYIGGKVWVAEEFGRPMSGSTIRLASSTGSASFAPALLVSRGIPRPSYPTTPDAVLGGYLTRPQTNVLT